MTKIKFNRCRNCPAKDYGVEKDKDGNELRVFDCKNNCMALSVSQMRI